MIRAAYQLVDQGIAEPVLLGDRDRIGAIRETLGLSFDPEIVDPAESDLEAYADRLHELRKRNGITRREAGKLVEDSDYLGSVMVETGDADAMLTGLTDHYPSALRPPLQVIGTASDADYAAGVYMLTFKNRVVFCVDATGNQDPSADVLEEVTRHTAELARRSNDPTNVLVFPNLEAGNIGYKLLQRLGDADAVGPMLVGGDKPVHVLQRGDEVKDIVNLAGVAVVDAQQELVASPSRDVVRFLWN